MSTSYYMPRNGPSRNGEGDTAVVAARAMRQLLDSAKRSEQTMRTNWEEFSRLSEGLARIEGKLQTEKVVTAIAAAAATGPSSSVAREGSPGAEPAHHRLAPRCPHATTCDCNWAFDAESRDCLLIGQGPASEANKCFAQCCWCFLLEARTADLPGTAVLERKLLDMQRDVPPALDINIYDRGYDQYQAASDKWWTQLYDKCPDRTRLPEATQRWKDALSAQRQTPSSSYDDQLGLSYIILLHKPMQPWRMLLCSLLHPKQALARDVVLLHIDRRAPPSFRTEVETFVRGRSNVHVLPAADSFAVRPFAASVMHAERACLAWLVAERAAGRIPRWDYNILLSGADFPVRPRSSLVNFLGRMAASDGIRNFLHLFTPVREAHRRRNRYRYATDAQGNNFLIMPPMHLEPLHFFDHFCNNEMWRIIHVDAAEYVLQAGRALQATAFFEQVSTPDESWMGVTLGHSPVHNASVASRVMWYHDLFSGVVDHPSVMPRKGKTVDDEMDLLQVALDDTGGQQSIFFARKFELTPGEVTGGAEFDSKSESGAGWDVREQQTSSSQAMLERIREDLLRIPRDDRTDAACLAGPGGAS